MFLLKQDQRNSWVTYLLCKKESDYLYIKIIKLSYFNKDLSLILKTDKKLEDYTD
jgi:hypothetical protein